MLLLFLLQKNLFKKKQVFETGTEKQKETIPNGLLILKVEYLSVLVLFDFFLILKVGRSVLMLFGFSGKNAIAECSMGSK